MDRIKEIIGDLNISPFYIVIGINILVSIFAIFKISNIESQETFTRLIIDHNSQSDLDAIKKQVCRRGIKSILSQNVDKKLVDYKLANKLIDADYSNFKVEDSESIRISLRSDFVCVAVLEYENNELRAFDIDLTEDKESAPLLYLIQDINENLVRGV